MKKITLLLMFFVASLSYAQISIDENFDDGTPAGWTDSYINTAAEACAGNSERDNLWASSTTGNITSPNQVGLSNGTDLTISFEYKIINFSGTNVATPAGWGTAELQYSTDDGVTWNTVLTIDDTNHVVANTCATMMATVPAASLPDGSDVKLQVANTWLAGDYYFYVDNFIAQQVLSNPPNCDSTLTETTDVATEGDISWSDATAAPGGYRITAGTTTGGTDLADNIDNGLSTIYSLGVLTANTTYYVTITPYNSVGPATGCVEQTFTTVAVPLCPTVTATPDTECGNFDSNLSWTAVSGADSYTVTVGTTSGGNDIADNEDVGTDLSYDFSGVANTQYFYTVNAVNSAGTSTGCEENDFTTATDACYCDPSSAGTNTTTFIDNVTTTSGIMNISNTGSGLSANHYVNNFDTMAVSSFADGVFDFNVEIQGGTLGLAIWIDWNDDSNYDISETVFTTTSYGNGPFTGTITVPTGTANGDYHMRIMADWNDPDPSEDACSLNSGRGETEDYKVTIQDAPSCVQPNSLNVANIGLDSAGITWNAGAITEWEYANLLATDAAPTSGTTVTMPSFDATGLTASTDYVFYVRSVCGTETSDFVSIAYTTSFLGAVCEAAIDITSIPYTTTDNTSDYDDDYENGSSPCSSFYMSGDDVFYSFTPTATESYRVSLTGISATYSGLHIWDGCIGGATAPACVGFEGDSGTDDRVVEVELTAATTYYIGISTWATPQSTDYTLSIIPLPPANDDCAAAEALALGTMASGDTTNATDSGVAAASCGATGGDKDIWYSFTATTTTAVTIDTTADTVVVYDACAGTEIACVGVGTTDVSGLVDGTTYFARVYNTGTAKVAGPIEITVTEKTLSTTSFDEQSLFSYYPNPVKNTLTLNAQKEISNVTVFNMLGQEVYRNAPNAVSNVVNMSNMQSGAYFVQVTVGNTVETVRIIKN